MMGSVRDKKGYEPGLDMDDIDRNMIFYPSQRCTVSCGTVCVDPAASKVLLVWNKRLGIWQLPKGRKNMGEDLFAAAFRETYEETGVAARPLPLKIATRSTRARGLGERMMENGTRPNGCNGAAGGAGAGVGTGADGLAADGSPGDPDVTQDLPNTEFAAMVRYPDPQAATHGTIKTVFFFAATADSTAALGQNHQDAHENLAAEWVPIQLAVQTLRFAAEASVVRKVWEDMKRSEFQLGQLNGGI